MFRDLNFLEGRKSRASNGRVQETNTSAPGEGMTAIEKMRSKIGAFRCVIADSALMLRGPAFVSLFVLLPTFLTSFWDEQLLVA
jgi:hypothetical protein